MAVIDTYGFYAGNIPVRITIESNPAEFILIYKVSISQIGSNTEVILDKIREELVEKVKLGIGDITDPKKLDYVRDKFQKTIVSLIRKYFPDITDETLDFFTTYLMHKSFGLGKIEILMGDLNLEEVVVNGAEDPIWVYHHKHGWLKTNIMLKDEEVIKHYSSLIGRKVGRSITLLTPLLDASLETGDRVNATLFPISTKGNTITIRKFATEPITITKFLQNRALSFPAAALIWLGVEFEFSTVISGGTATGKTSMLNAVGGFFPPNQRIISVEDSVTGDAEILYRENREIKKSSMSELIDKQIKNDKITLHDGTELAHNQSIEVLSMDKKGKVSFSKPSSFIRHKVKKPIIEIRLASGRKISVTKDHSLFSLINNEVKEVKGSSLKEGSFIATPRKISYTGTKKVFDLSNHLDKFSGFMIQGKPVKNLIKKYGKEVVLNKSNRQHYRNCDIVPVEVFKKLIPYIKENDKSKLQIVPSRSNKNGRISLPLIIKFDSLMGKIAGMWLADGCYDKKSILISDPNDESKKIIEEFAKRFSARTNLHSDKVTTMINSKCLRVLFKEVFGFKGNAYTKEMPSWIFNLEDKVVGNLLKGYFSGDGCVKKYEICVSSSSRKLLEDVQTLLLRFEILMRIGNALKKDKTYEARIGTVKFLSLFKKHVGFTQNYKKDKLDRLLDKKPSDVSDIIPLSKNCYLELKKAVGAYLKEKLTYKSWTSWQGRYKKRSHIGRSYLSILIKSLNIADISLLNQEMQKIVDLSKNDIFWDRIVTITEKSHDGYVYDLSVPERENFVCSNIIAHNTRELELAKYMHWVPMVTRSPNIEGKGGIAMLDLIVNSLRMRPDRIVVGEIRRKQEAETLFEAMHTGHSVYATVHANNAEETVNRLTNPPIEVPKALLPAIGMIIVMYRNRRTGIRRIFQLAEITNSSEANVLMQYDFTKDNILSANESKKFMPDLEMQTGMTRNDINNDLRDKVEVLKWLVKNNVIGVNEIGKVVATYYTNKEGLMSFITKH